MTADNYEYGIKHRSFPRDLHRGPMTYDEADTWLRECNEMGMEPGLFVMVRRPTGTWEVCDGPVD